MLHSANACDFYLSYFYLVLLLICLILCVMMYSLCLLPGSICIPANRLIHSNHHIYTPHYHSLTHYHHPLLITNPFVIRHKICCNNIIQCYKNDSLIKLMMFQAATLSKMSFIVEAVKCLLRVLVNAGHSIRMCLTVCGQWQAEHSGWSVPDNK